MRKYLLIGIGGALGAIMRYGINGLPIDWYHGKVPLNTLIINVTGSLLLALILTIAFEVWEFDTALRLGTATGFLGAYTTFSTFCKEIMGLLKEGLYFFAISYMVLSVVMGLAAVYLGVNLTRKTAARLVRRSEEESVEIRLEELEGDVE